MGTPLICDRCGEEITPGSKVTILEVTPAERILSGDDALVVHLECPKEDS